MRIVICDDDKIILQTLRKYLEEFFYKIGTKDYEIIEFSSGDELLDDPSENDIVFLDIEMPGLDGITVGKEIKRNYPRSIIIIVTSFSEYLDDAMKFSVFRYLSKPIDKNRLFRNMKDAIEIYLHRNLLIGIECNGEYKKIDSDDIVMLETRGRKIILYTVNGEYELAGTIKEWSDKLRTTNFYMCHRSYIVNIARISAIKEDKILLENGKYQAYLAKRKHTDIKRKFMLYLEKNREQF